MAIYPDPAVLYPDVEAHGSLGAALRAVAQGRLASVPLTSPEADPLLAASVDCTLPYREPLHVSAYDHKRLWSIRGVASFDGMALIEGTTDDLAQVAEAARAWHDGAALSDICEAAPFVRQTGRFDVPDLDPGLLTESEWRHLRTEANELEYPWQPAYQALIEHAYAQPALRRLYPFTSHWALRFSTTTRPRLSVVGPLLETRGVGEYALAASLADEDPARFTTAAQAVAAAVRQLPSTLGPVTLGR
ncbi:DUF6193 family natural product biosynthesis protein [Streptomyces sp. NPDC048424]|uniref:DUF6193 family natural product biosynthesis protein n=1 Tax=Streptomyces sp. NPDC048424 TaxID=3155265 RepID=UPI0034210690